MIISNPLVDKARLFAFGAHGATAQKRKYTDEPYHNHLENVARLLIQYGELDPTTLAAAYLHDVVEDTKITHEFIRKYFGGEVSVLVYYLTDKSIGSEEKRAARKKIDRLHIAKAPTQAKTIKLADLIDNTSTIVEKDPGFAKVYMAEKRLLLPYLAAGNHGLLENAWRIVNEYFDGEDTNDKT